MPQESISVDAGSEARPGKQISYVREFIAVKGEDTAKSSKLELAGDRWVSFHAIFDGHGGRVASEYCSRRMPAAVAKCYKFALGEHVERLELACKQAFQQMDNEIRGLEHAHGHGTTATCLIIDEDFITVANVGDSAAMITTPDGLKEITADHRVARNKAEEKRLLEGGAAVGRAKGFGGGPVGPLRVYPGGLAVSRSIGDDDAHDAVICEPVVTTMPYPPTGALILIASDGVWDYISATHTEKLIETCKVRGGIQWLTHAVMKAVRSGSSMMDDATLVTVHLPGSEDTPGLIEASAAAAKPNLGGSMKKLFGMRANTRDASAPKQNNSSSTDPDDSIHGSGRGVHTHRMVSYKSQPETG